MPRQSEDLAAETAAMRAVDRALQAAAELPHRAHGRVLRYLSDLVGDRIADHLASSPSAGGMSRPWTASDGSVGGGGAGGSGSAADITAGGGGSGGFPAGSAGAGGVRTKNIS